MSFSSIAPCICSAALLFASVPVVLQAQASSTITDASPIQQPQHPITLDQLQKFSAQIQSIEPMKKLTLEAAEKQRATLPPWFPQAVWDQIENKMANIDLPSVALPVYRKYVSAEDADAMILFFSGPVGEQLGKNFIHREVRSAESGTSGAATTQNALSDTSHSSDVELGAKRLHELSPEDQARVVAARDHIMSSWKQLSDQLSSTYDAYMNNFIQKELATHNKELVAAKTAYLQKSSNQH
jgi:hypothetical protein